MSAEESKPTDGEPFDERDDRETKMTYDQGRVPLYVAIAWVVFIACYIIYMWVLGKPDLGSWGAP